MGQRVKQGKVILEGTKLEGEWPVGTTSGWLSMIPRSINDQGVYESKLGRGEPEVPGPASYRATVSQTTARLPFIIISGLGI